MKSSPDKQVTKLNSDNNALHHCESLNKLGSKNRLRIHGTAILQRDNHPDVIASYDYSTAYANAFFEEDVNQLESFELNKIALGMTIYKKEDSPFRIASNSSGHHKNGVNGLKNGDSNSFEKYSDSLSNGNYNTPRAAPALLTDVIWSRMDMVNPSHNPNAYIIKQYYKTTDSSNQYEVLPHHGERCNTFLCGFISCLMIMAAIGYALVFYSKEFFQP